MAAPVTPQEMHQRLLAAFRGRRDTGFKKLAINQFLEPSNPFQPETRRRLSPDTALILFMAALALISFIYFNTLP